MSVAEALKRPESDLDAVSSMQAVSIEEFYSWAEISYENAAQRIDEGTSHMFHYQDLVDSARIMGRIIRTRPEIFECMAEKAASFNPYTEMPGQQG